MTTAPPPAIPFQLLPYQQRVVGEHVEIVERLQKLLTFLGSRTFEQVTPTERERMLRQAAAMQTYANVLEERIKAFEKANG